MESRETFLKGEITLINKLLEEIYDYCSYSFALKDEKKIRKDY